MLRFQDKLINSVSIHMYSVMQYETNRESNTSSNPSRFKENTIGKDNKSRDRIQFDKTIN